MRNKSIFLLAVILLGTIACKKDTEQTVVEEKVEIPFKKEGELSFYNGDSLLQTIDIEIAETNNEQALGLMHRSSMGEKQGMLFIHKEDQANPMGGYWMKNTRIPLDIIYFDKDTLVSNIAKNAPPLTEIGIAGPTRPKRFVVEINGGLSDKWGIKDSMTTIKWKKL